MAAQIVSRSLSEPRQWRQLGPDLEISGGENKNKKVEDPSFRLIPLLPTFCKVLLPIVYFLLPA